MKTNGPLQVLPYWLGNQATLGKHNLPSQDRLRRPSRQFDSIKWREVLGRMQYLRCYLLPIVYVHDGQVGVRAHHKRSLARIETKSGGRIGRYQLSDAR